MILVEPRQKIAGVALFRQAKSRYSIGTDGAAVIVLFSPLQAAAQRIFDLEPHEAFFVIRHHNAVICACDRRNGHVRTTTGWSNSRKKM